MSNFTSRSSQTLTSTIMKIALVAWTVRRRAAMRRRRPPEPETESKETARVHPHTTHSGFSSGKKKVLCKTFARAAPLKYVQQFQSDSCNDGLCGVCVAHTKPANIVESEEEACRVRVLKVENKAICFCHIVLPMVTQTLVRNTQHTLSTFTLPPNHPPPRR